MVSLIGDPKFVVFTSYTFSFVVKPLLLF